MTLNPHLLILWLQYHYFPCCQLSHAAEDGTGQWLVNLSMTVSAADIRIQHLVYIPRRLLWFHCTVIPQSPPSEPILSFHSELYSPSYRLSKEQAVLVLGRFKLLVGKQVSTKGKYDKTNTQIDAWGKYVMNSSSNSVCSHTVNQYWLNRRNYRKWLLKNI